jgi:hypothetical protein
VDRFGLRSQNHALPLRRHEQNILACLAAAGDHVNSTITGEIRCAGGKVDKILRDDMSYPVPFAVIRSRRMHRHEDCHNT